MEKGGCFGCIQEIIRDAHIQRRVRGICDDFCTYPILRSGRTGWSLGHFLATLFIPARVHTTCTSASEGASAIQWDSLQSNLGPVHISDAQSSMQSA